MSDFAALATLRYDKEAVRLFLEGLRVKLMLSTDLFTESWLYQDGKAEGMAEGQAQGLIAGKRDALRLAWRKRFPGSGELTELDLINSSTVLDQLLLVVLEAKTLEEGLSALRTALLAC